MTDRELLELAAKAAGYNVSLEYYGPDRHGILEGRAITRRIWNPLQDDGDALRLAVDLGVAVHTVGHRSAACAEQGQFTEYHNSDKYAATRRAIVRAAAEIGKNA